MPFRILFYLITLIPLSSYADCVDTIPPRVDSVIITSINQLKVYFSEAVALTDAENTRNYFIASSNWQPTYAQRDNNPRVVQLVFTDSFLPRHIYDLSVSSISDLFFNTMPEAQLLSFYKYHPMPFDVVINELMADPSPPVSLPEVEWIELYNNSPFAINLSGWRLAKATGRTGPLPNYTLQPDSFLLVCSAGSLTNLLPWGPVKSVTNFPALSNLGDCISLLSPAGMNIHTVNYTDDWYQNELKKQGGWSLEMIDSKNPCGDIENWAASIHSIGSTPARINSIKSINSDNQPPKILWLYVPDSIHIVLHASEPLDSSSAVINSQYFLSDNLGEPTTVSLEAPLFQDIRLTLSTPLLRGQFYRITIQPLQDCVMQQGAASQVLELALPETPESGEVVMNEILFNPPTDGVDYVEVYNRSKKAFDLQKLFIANRNTMGLLDNIVKLSGANRLFFPGEYIAITDDTAFVKKTYRPLNVNSLLSHGALPSFNDDEGTVAILRADGQVVDELHYDDRWHFEFITNTEGVSLERIDPNAPTQTKHNWHSAAESAGYGTPGYKNSQTVIGVMPEGTLTVTPKMITPNNDGWDDYLSIEYRFPEPGNVANIKLFDISGRFIRWIANNFQCGTEGRLIWDGLGANNSSLIPGPYLIYTETFNKQEKKRKFKNVVLVGR